MQVNFFLQLCMFFNFTYLDILPNDNTCSIVIPRHQPLVIVNNDKSDIFIEIQLALFERAQQGELLLIEDQFLQFLSSKINMEGK
jgi:hypothetical protein